MSFGLVELITLLLSLSGFSLQPNPKAPTADQVLRYAVPDADVVAHVDARAIIGNNYRLLTALPNQAPIQAVPELARSARRAVNEIEGLRGLVKTTTGIDLTTDIDNATLFVRIPPPGRHGPPDLLFTLRGKLSVANLDRIAKVVGAPARNGLIELPPGQLPVGAIAVTKDGTFLAGATQLVKERVAATWRPPARPARSRLAHVASVLDAKPVFAFALTMSPSARKQVLDEFKGEKNFITDVISRHQLAAVSVFTNGIGWTWIDSTRSGLDAMAQISEGTMDMLRAAQIAPRGFAKIVMGALESYRGNKQVDALIRRKADLWKIVDSYTGDGNFKVAIDKNPATLRLTARATGASLSDVLPAGLALPGMMFFVLVGSEAQKPAVSSPPPPAQTTKPPRLSPRQKMPKPKPTPAPAPPARPRGR